MNNKEKFHAVMNFDLSHGAPAVEWAPWWDKTLARWRGEGLSGELDEQQVQREMGLDPLQWLYTPHIAAGYPSLPHGQGAVADISDYRRLRQYLFPPINWDRPEARRAIEAGEDTLLWVIAEGFFWFPRTLLGIERHLYSFYDQAGLLHMICDELADFTCALMRGLSERGVRVDFMTFAEDMAYNHGPMISKEMFDEFMAPYFHRVIPECKKTGGLIFIDCDGFIEEMIPWFTSVGIQGVLPLERQAGNDICRIRENHPRFRMIGGFDKMVMHKGKEAVEAECARLRPAVLSGGFLPCCDHQTPPAVSISAYREYVRNLRKLCVSPLQ